MSLDGAPSFSDLRTPEDLTGLDLDSEVENRIQALRARGRAEAQAAYKAADALKAFGRTDLANKVVLAVPVDFITERRSLRHRRDTAFGSSFAAAMGSYRQVTKHLTELHGRKAVQSVFQKVQGPQLATQLGLKVAERYQTNVRFQDLDPAPGSIIKPTADSGSQGVIIYGHDGTLKNLLSKETYTDLAAALAWLRRAMDDRKVSSRRFHVEELLVGPDGNIPHDIKFYTFYGELGVTLEIKRHTEKKLHSFYDSAGEEVVTGKYPNALFCGEGIPAEWGELAREVSSKFPRPFLRLDCYRTSKGLYYGEFTPTPGGFEGFNLEWDRILGENYARAQARLTSDLIAGKEFPEYKEFAAA